MMFANLQPWATFSWRSDVCVNLAVAKERTTTDVVGAALYAETMKRASEEAQTQAGHQARRP